MDLTEACGKPQSDRYDSACRTIVNKDLERAVTSGVADILVRNARLQGRGDALADIAISDGVILKVAARVDIDARAIVDAQGNLATPSYVNPHLHLCKVWTLPMMSEAALDAYHAAGMSEARKAIDLAAAVKANYDPSWISPTPRPPPPLAPLPPTPHT